MLPATFLAPMATVCLGHGCVMVMMTVETDQMKSPSNVVRHSFLTI